MDGVGERESYLLNHPSVSLCGFCGGRSALKHGYFKNMAAINREKKKKKRLADIPAICMY